MSIPTLWSFFNKKVGIFWLILESNFDKSPFLLIFIILQIIYLMNLCIFLSKRFLIRLNWNRTVRHLSTSTTTLSIFSVLGTRFTDTLFCTCTCIWRNLHFFFSFHCTWVLFTSWQVPTFFIKIQSCSRQMRSSSPLL